MKKVFIIAIAAIAASLTASAQKKGDMYISATLDLKTSSSVQASGNSSVKESGGLNFGFSPEFGIFLIDRLELNVGLGYEMSKVPNGGKTENQTDLFDIDNIFNIGAGLNYHFRVADKLSYAPGVKFLVGFGGAQSQVSASEVEQAYKNTSFTLRLSLMKFEFRPAEHFAMTFEAGSLDFNTDTKTRNVGNTISEERVNTFGLGLNIGAEIGFKCYF